MSMSSPDFLNGPCRYNGARPASVEVRGIMTDSPVHGDPLNETATGVG